MQTNLNENTDKDHIGPRRVRLDAETLMQQQVDSIER